MADSKHDEEPYRFMAEKFFKYDPEKGELESRPAELTKPELHKLSGYSIKFVEKVDENTYLPSRSFLDSLKINLDLKATMIVYAPSDSKVWQLIKEKIAETERKKLIPELTEGFRLKFEKEKSEYRKQIEHQNNIIRGLEKIRKDFANKCNKLEQKIIELRNPNLNPEEVKKLIEDRDRYINYYNKTLKIVDEKNKIIDKLNESIGELEEDRSKLKKKVGGLEKLVGTQGYTISSLEERLKKILDSTKLEEQGLRTNNGKELKSDGISETKPPDDPYRFDETCQYMSVKTDKGQKSLKIFSLNGKLIKAIEVMYRLYNDAEIPRNMSKSVLEGMVDMNFIIYHKKLNLVNLTMIGKKIIKELTEKKPEIFEEVGFEIDFELNKEQKYRFDREYQYLYLKTYDEYELKTDKVKLFNNIGHKLPYTEIMCKLYKGNMEVPEGYSSIIWRMKKFDVVNKLERDLKLTEVGNEIIEKLINIRPNLIEG